jgi:hypothetical protein
MVKLKRKEEKNMEFKTYENIKVRVYFEKNSLTKLFDGKVLFTDQEPIKFFSCDKKEISSILSAFEVLNIRRFGRVK